MKYDGVEEGRRLWRELEEIGAIATATQVPHERGIRCVAQNGQQHFLERMPRSFAPQIEEGSKGHYLLSTGKHSNIFVQTALALADLRVSEAIGFQLYKLLQESTLIDLESVDVIIGPPMGAVALTKALQIAIDNPRIEAMYLEKNGNGAFHLARGFSVNGKRVLLVDDVITTGGSIRKVKQACEASVELHSQGCSFVGMAVIVNRATPEMTEAMSVTLPLVAALTSMLAHWTPEECPYCWHGIPLYAW